MGVAETNLVSAQGHDIASFFILCLNLLRMEMEYLKMRNSTHHIILM